MLMSRKTRPCGECCNLGPAINDHGTGYCHGGPIPWRGRGEFVHGCKIFNVLQKGWNPEKQWHYPEGGHHDSRRR